MLFVLNIEILKTVEYQTFLKQTLVLYIIYSKCDSEYDKIFKEKEPIKILEILDLISNMVHCQKNMAKSNR